MIHKEKDNIWKANYKREFKELLELEVKCINDKTKYNIDYINLANGLFNLNTVELEAHIHDIFTTCQLPFEYDKNAKAKNFMDFIEKLTLGDNELKV